MSGPKTYFAVLSPDGRLGFVLDVYPEERLPYLAEFMTTGERLVGAYDSEAEAEAALMAAAKEKRHG
jgi:hypothetical protein